MIGLPVLLFLVLFLYFLRKAQGQNTNILSLRKSSVRLVADDERCAFADVGGCEDAKEQLGDVIDFLEHPDRWQAAGVRLPRGVLLEGPPGCGKTLLARAVAGESKARFYLISASEFVEMFVGVGAARVRDTFEKASKDAPAVLFIDEIDAIGRKRGSGIGASHDEREQTLNQILVCMDGFRPLDRVVVIAATNRADVLDPALLRPGRFDRRIEIPALSRDARRAVLEVHVRGKRLAPDVDLDGLADRTAGHTGAGLECLVNEAGLLAVRRLRKSGGEETGIRAEDFEAALSGRPGESGRFDCLDALLVESTTQLAHPTGKARVRLTLVEGMVVEGEIAWADATHIKLRGGGAGEAVVVPKGQIKTLEALDGTEWAADVAPDRFAGRVPGTA
jgi:ATP-dependent metalloprotease FtsH